MATYTNTKDVLGEIPTLDGLVDHSLTDFTDTDITTLGQEAFYANNQIKNITLPNLTSIGQYAFYNCTSLNKLRVGLEKSTVCTLVNPNALSNTVRGLIFVPSDLVSSYKSASNWSTYASRIYADGDPTAPEWDESEITDTDEELFARINTGTAASYYKLGQYKSVNFGTLGTLRMQIIGINTDELSDGSGYAQLTWFPMELPSSTHRMNPSKVTGNSGTGSIDGWGESEMRIYLNQDVWPLIPLRWQNVIKAVKKYSRIYNTSEQVENDVLTNDKIWLLSTREVNGTTNATYNETAGPVYSLAFADNNTRVRKVGTSASYWWLRSAGSNDGGFAYANSNGSWSSGSGANSSRGVGFGYCT